MPSDKPLRVLLVDDEDDFRSNLARLLHRRGCTVTPAADGAGAFEALAGPEAFDAVVLDVRMPGMDGIAVLRRLRRDMPDLEVVMLTGHACVADGAAAIHHGAFDYLQKPCEPDDLVRTLQAAARAGAMRRRPVLWPRHTAAEMTFCTLRRLGPEAGLNEVMDFFDLDRSDQAADTLFVIGADDRLCGMLTRNDLLAAARAVSPEIEITWDRLRRNPQWLPRQTAGGILRNGRAVLRAAPDDPLPDLARRMMAARIRSMPVVDADRVTGIVRLRDVLQYIDRDDLNAD